LAAAEATAGRTMPFSAMLSSGPMRRGLTENTRRAECIGATARSGAAEMRENAAGIKARVTGAEATRNVIMRERPRIGILRPRISEILSVGHF
jgi:hypothetical protein